MTELERLAEIQKLAALPRLEYKTRRIVDAKRLKLRVSVLESEVKHARGASPKKRSNTRTPTQIL
jgi:hypothetical protein